MINYLLGVGTGLLIAIVIRLICSRHQGIEMRVSDERLSSLYKEES
jgi:hypothetical protein